MRDKIRINFFSFSKEQLSQVIKEILLIARRSGATVKGPIPLPTKTRRYTVNRSPHVDKKSRDQFQLCFHKRLLYITNTTQVTMDQLMKLEVSPGVKVDIKVASK